MENTFVLAMSINLQDRCKSIALIEFKLKQAQRDEIPHICSLITQTRKIK